MIQSDREALHYTVIAQVAFKIEKTAKDLAAIYMASNFSPRKAKLRKEQLQKYFDELNSII